MNNIQTLWHRLTTPHATDENDARREYMTRVIYVMLILVGLALFIAFAIGQGVGNLRDSGLGITAAIEIALVLGWWAADKGYWRPASFALPLIFFILALRTNYSGGVGSVAILQYAIVVLLAIMLRGGVVQWIALGLSIIAYISISWMHVQKLLPPVSAPEESFALYATATSGMLVFIALMQWFYTKQLYRTMAEARTYANELAEHQAGLEQTVAERTAELNRLLHSMSDAVIATDPDGVIRSWNPAAERILGWTAEETLGESVAMLFPTQDVFLTLRDEVVKPAMAGTPQQAEVSMICKDNSERVARIGFSAIFDEQHNPTGIVAVVADITEQREMEAERERLQQEVIAAQRQVIQDLSTPVIPVMQGIIVMPLVGNIDSMRAQDVTRSLLAGITQHRARIVIIDVTGVMLMDTGIVNRLNKTIQAAQLKGAQTIVTGISDAVAESIVDLGIDWSGITTLSNLQMGLVRALNNLGLKLEGNSR